jgi:hypothetical protein
MAFFSYRYDSEEISLIYRNYRGNLYFATRKSWEFWYTRKTNSYNIKKDTITKRKKLIIKNLEKLNIPISELVNSTVDFAGDKGQFIPDIPGTKYLFDLSAQKSDAGGGTEEVNIVNDLSQVEKPIDLIISQHLLEHVDDPGEVLELFSNNIEFQHDIADLNEKKNYKTQTFKLDSNNFKKVRLPLIFLEVPMDRYKVSRFATSIYYRNYLVYLTNHRRLFILVDFISGLTRQYFGRLPFFGIIKQSEHINYFNEQSLNYLFTKYNLKIELVEHTHYRAGGIKFKSLIFILKK